MRISRADPGSAIRPPPTPRVQARTAQLRIATDRRAHRETPDRIKRLAEWREPGLPGTER